MYIAVQNSNIHTVKMSILNNIIDANKNAQSLESQVFERILNIHDTQNHTFNATQPIPSSQRNISQIQARFAGLADLIASLEKNTENSLDLIPYIYLSELDNALAAIGGTFRDILSSLNFSQDNPITNIDPVGFVVTASQGNSVNVAGKLASVDTQIDLALHHFYQINPLFKRPDYSKLSSITKHLADALDLIKKHEYESKLLLEIIEEQKNAIVNTHEAASKTNDSVTAMLTQMTATKQEADDKLTKITGYEATATTKYAFIEDVHTKTTTLNTAITNYKGQFDLFQNELTERVKVYNEGNTNLDTLTKNLQEQDTKIQDLTTEAKSMLNYVTVAGLAKGFGDRHESLKTEQETANKVFKNGTLALFGSSLLPSLYLLIMVLTETEIRPVELSILLLLIIPAAIFTRFAANRHHNLFCLREQYAHKYAIAFSIESFKNQVLSDDKKSEIVAGTFAQFLISNPAEIISGKGNGEDHPLPIWDKLLGFFTPKNSS